MASGGWRSFINSAALVGLIITCLCWLYIPVSSQETFSSPKYSKQLSGILSNNKAWINGLFVGLSFTVITVFGAMWAVPFIQVKLACSLKQASFIDAMIFWVQVLVALFLVNWPLFLNAVTPLMIGSSLSTAFLILATLYLPIRSPVILALLMLLIGLCCGAYMLAFSIANELAPTDSLSTCTGFTNTLAMLSAPLMQPLIGYILDSLTYPAHTYSLANYQTALLIIPFSLFLSSYLVLFLPEKTSNY
ncbi:hypothetical protein [Legionella tunisiensis]|uniref:hypothetical protein n=1 Tax=Legionella tunisiensis TaxID=1034944 RepID=UPI0002E6FF16